jgi:transcriptional regulator with XRE-family HTH domain
MEYLRAWRESLGLSRQNVVDNIGTLSPAAEGLDQATLAKWESGESRVTTEDLEMLAQIYGVRTDRLFFQPGDEETPKLLAAAHEIIVGRDPEAVRAWLKSGGFLPVTAKHTKKD